MAKDPRTAGYYKKVRDFVDQDYVHKLSPEEKEWLDKFNQIYYADKNG